MDDVVGLVFLGCLGLLVGACASEYMRVRRLKRQNAQFGVPGGFEEQMAVEVQERALLWRVLTPEQREAVQSRGCVDVVAASGKRYRLYNGFLPAQELGPKGDVVASLCIQQCQQTSIAGQLLAELLLLQANEAAFLSTARRTALHGRVASP